MRISTQTERLVKVYGEGKAIEKLAEIGYDSFDFSMFGITKEGNPVGGNNFEAYVKNLRRIADESGISCNQTHAPFPSFIEGNEPYNKSIFPYLVRAIEVTGLLGGKTVIVHPATFSQHKIGGDSLCWDTNIQLYTSLLPYAKSSNVKIALENMFNWYSGDETASPSTCSSADEFVKYLDGLDSEYFVACLDLGHSSMANTGGGSAAEMIHALGGRRLKALHIHDNDLVHDLHTLPFTEKINWDETMKALKEIQYDGDLTFEADAFLAKFPDELIVHASKLMLEVGRYFISKYEL